MAVIVAFGTYDAQRHPRIGIVIDGLRTHDIEVTELNHSTGFVPAPNPFSTSASGKNTERNDVNGSIE